MGPIRTAPGATAITRWDGNDSFWPGDVAAGVVGGAGQPGGGDCHLSARRRGFTPVATGLFCVPDTYSGGEDGRKSSLPVEL